jgi:hypothetical protein
MRCARQTIEWVRARREMWNVSYALPLVTPAKTVGKISPVYQKPEHAEVADLNESFGLP